MKEEQDFLKTITLLMRLTREGRIKWKKDAKAFLLATLGSAQSQEAFETELADMRFRLEHMPASLSESNPMRHALGQYRLIVKDPGAAFPITSPPMKAAKDLASLIHSVEEKRDENLRKRLAKVNKRLEAAS